jgi:hypothetical protein
MKPAAPDADDHLAMYHPTSPPPSARATITGPGSRAAGGLKPAGGPRAAGWLEEAGLSLVQRLRVDDAARATAEPGRVWRSEPAPGVRPPPAAGSVCGSAPRGAHLPTTRAR